MRGPYSKTIGSDTTPEFINRVWYRTDYGQRVRTPLPFNQVRGISIDVHPALLDPAKGRVVSAKTMTGYAIPTFAAGALTRHYAELYQKWYDKARASSQQGVNWAERAQTLKLLSDALHLVKNPISELAKLYRRGKHDPWRTPLKQAGGAYLAYHFGVEPLIQDIYALTERLADMELRKLITAHRNSVFNYKTDNGYDRYEFAYKIRYRQTAVQTQTNPGLALLNDVGLVNPMSIAWELIPFSFVVDWFYPIGDILRGITDELGYSYSNAYVTRFIQCDIAFTQLRTNYPLQAVANGHRNRFRTIFIERMLSNPTPPGFEPMALKPWSRSLTRALTSISLLSQFLKR